MKKNNATERAAFAVMRKNHNSESPVKHFAVIDCGMVVFTHTSYALCLTFKRNNGLTKATIRPVR